MTKEQVFSNLIWRFLERVGAQLVTFVVSIIVARIVGPDAYGIVAIVMVVTNVLSVFVDSGLGTALIQKKDVDNVDYSTVFYFNLISCAVIYLAVYCLAPSIAKFYGNVDLSIYIRVSALSLFIAGFKNIQIAYVSRNLLFNKYFQATMVGTVIAAFVGISMALMGYGVWALIVQNLVNMSIDTLVLYFIVGWKPILSFSFRRLKQLFTYGVKILVAALMDMIFNEARTLVIGKKYSTGDLAYFKKGQQFPNLIAQNINSSIDNVLLSVLSKENEDVERVKQMTKRSIKMSSYVLWPIMVGLAVCSESFICLLLGEEWLPCVPYIRIFCFMYVFYPIISTNGEVIKSLGRSDIFLKLNITNNVIGIVLLMVTMNISVYAIAFGFLVWTLTSQIINTIPNQKLIHYSYFEQMKDISPSILLSIFMGIVVFFIGRLNWNYIILLCIQVISGIAIYVIGSYVLKFEEFFYILGLVKNLLSKKKGN